MFERTKHYYEVLAYKAATDDEPRDRDEYTRKAQAFAQARRKASTFGRVELNVVYVNADDDNDVRGADLLAAWEHGTKTTK